jgi:Ca2+-transporting ATPase
MSAATNLPSSCRRLDNGFNIFEGMFKNYWFLSIQFIIIGFQIVIVFVGGAAFSVHKLNGPQWGYSIVLGILSIPVAIIIRLIPDELFEKFIPHLPNRKHMSPTLVVEDDQEVQRWNPGLEEIRDELTFLKKLRGGRMSELAYKLQHPRESFLPRSRSASRSRSRNSRENTLPSPHSIRLEFCLRCHCYGWYHCWQHCWRPRLSD